MKLFEVDTLRQARDKLESVLKKSAFVKKSQMISLKEAVGRILAEDIRAMQDVPAFDRSTVDGYALRSAKAAEWFGREKICEPARFWYLRERGWRRSISARFPRPDMLRFRFINSR